MLITYKPIAWTTTYQSTHKQRTQININDKHNAVSYNKKMTLLTTNGHKCNEHKYSTIKKKRKDKYNVALHHKETTQLTTHLNLTNVA